MGVPVIVWDEVYDGNLVVLLASAFCCSSRLGADTALDTEWHLKKERPNCSEKLIIIF